MQLRASPTARETPNNGIDENCNGLGDDVIEGAVENVVVVIEDIPPTALSNANNAGALQNKLDAVIELVDAGDYAAALDKLASDVIPKTKGCATSEPPAPDRNDWVEDCAEQAVLYPELRSLQAWIEQLL